MVQMAQQLSRHLDVERAGTPMLGNHAADKPIFALFAFSFCNAVPIRLERCMRKEAAYCAT